MAMSFGILAVAAIIGVTTNMVTLATTYDYSKATMRGGTLNLDTATDQQRTSSGLPIDYAFGWSYGTAETFSLMVPNIYGGASGQAKALGKNSNLAKLASSQGASDEEATNFAQDFAGNVGGLYWGNQPFTSGPVYIGAIMCFLFIFSMVYLDGKNKWWMLAACFMAILMSWGKNLMGFNEFLFNYLPMYNKFRAPTMALVIPQLLFPFAAVLSLHKLFFDEENREEATKKFKMAGFITIGVFAIIAMFYTSFSYQGNNDDRIISALTQQAAQTRRLLYLMHLKQTGNPFLAVTCCVLFCLLQRPSLPFS